MANQEDDFPLPDPRGYYDPEICITSVEQIKNGIFLYHSENNNYYKVVSDTVECSDEGGCKVVKIKVQKCTTEYVGRFQAVVPNTRFYEYLDIRERVPSGKIITLKRYMYRFFRVNNRYYDRDNDDGKIYDDGDNEVLDDDPRWEHPEDF